MFFSKHFKYVCAVDGSETAIATCVESANEGGIKNIDFIHSLISDHDLLKKIKNKLAKFGNDCQLHIYSRFFLHSINDKDEDQLIDVINKLMEDRQGEIFLEFRTKEDEKLSKYTGTHYRRYVDPTEIIAKFSRLGFKVIYQVEGFGFAKYQIDDAHVARLVFSRA